MKRLSAKELLWVQIAAILVIVVALYGRTVNFGFTSLDDKPLIADNLDFLKNAANLPQAFRQPYFKLADGGSQYYRPLVTVSFMIDAHLSGAKFWAYHLTNVILHAAECILLLLLLRQFGFSRGAIFWSTALFAAHPAFASIIAWVPGRNDSLLAIWVLSSWLCYLRRAYRWHLVFFILGLLTKETAVIIPVLCLVSRWNPPRKIWGAWLSIIAGFFWIRQIIVTTRTAETIIDRMRVSFTTSPLLITSLGKIITPIFLAPIAIAVDTPLWPGMVALTLLVIITCLPALRDQVRYRIIGLGALAYILFLLPTLPIADAMILENRLYLPAVGICIVLAEVLSQVSFAQWPARLAAGAALVIFAVLNWQYVTVFKDRDIFGEEAVKRSPHSSLARLNYGTSLHIKGKMTDAETEYVKAIQLNPRETVVQNNLALIRMAQMNFAEADRLLKNEIAINPTYDKAFYNRGLALKNMGDFEAARLSFLKAVEINPGNVEAWMELFVESSRRGDTENFARYQKELERRGVRMDFH